MCRKFTYWQDLASAASFVNTKLASLKVLPTSVALSSPEMPNVCSLGKWSESGGAVERRVPGELVSSWLPSLRELLRLLVWELKPEQIPQKRSIMGKGALHPFNQRHTSWILLKFFYETVEKAN